MSSTFAVSSPSNLAEFAGLRGPGATPPPFAAFRAPNDGPEKLVDAYNTYCDLFRLKGLQVSTREIAENCAASESLLYKSFREVPVLARVVERGHAHMVARLQAAALRDWPEQRAQRSVADLELAFVALTDAAARDRDFATMAHVGLLLWRRPTLLAAPGRFPLRDEDERHHVLQDVLAQMPEMRAFRDVVRGLAAAAPATDTVHSSWTDAEALVAAFVAHLFLSVRWLDEAHAQDTAAHVAALARNLQGQFAALLVEGRDGGDAHVDEAGHDGSPSGARVVVAGRA